MNKIVFGSVITVVLLSLVVFGMSISYNNRYTELTNLASAQEKANEVIFDNLWKTIAQKAEIAEKYKESLI